jgi:hypothetical protein
MANLGAVCARKIDGRPAEFGTAGYTMDHVFVLYDRLTNSVWYPVHDDSLQAVGGTQKGTSIPFRDEMAPVPLGEWLDVHPASTVLLPAAEELVGRSE